MHRGLYSINIPKNSRLKISSFVFISLLIWVTLSHALGILKIFRVASPFVPLIALGVPIITIKFLSKSQTFSKLVNVLPNHWIIGIQVFRLLGIVFITLYIAGVLPGEFAIPSGVGDIIIGITAPLIAFLYFIKNLYARKLAAIWNYLGIADLVIAIVMGSITAPTMVQVLSFDLPNEPIISYPLVTIPTFAVPFSLILHFISLRIIKKDSERK